MLRYLLSLVITLFIALPSLAQRVQGYDVLGLAKYCNTYLQAPRLPAVSTLMNTFGDPLPCLDKALARGDLKVVQIDLIDATCHRNRVCPPGTPKPNDLKVIKARASQVQKLAAKYPNTEFWVSPGLEHDEKNTNIVKGMLKAAQDGCPKCRVINSPFSGARVPGVPLELHGTRVREFAVSGDGASSFDADTSDSDRNGFNHSKSGSDQTYAWIPEFNLRCTGEKSFTAPLRRSNRPTLGQFRQAKLILGREQGRPGNSPSACKSVREASGQEIVKPNAEAYCNGQPNDSRGNKPLLILRNRGSKNQTIPVLAPSGKKVASLKYWGTFENPSLHRWYMGNSSGHTPDELYDAAGGEWAYAQFPNGECVRFNTIRRMGVYR